MKFKLKSILLTLLCAITLACSSDDDNTIESPSSDSLIGEWLRNDFNENIQYKLTFNTDNTVLRTFSTQTNDDAISTASSYNWTISNDIITIENFENNTNASTGYEFLSNETVVLTGLSEFEFVRQ
ncbi:hypothetical protein [Lacinutrix mariniflava]|uniref:hypothetical protein n=1 Tax=Lacinutrix mariniflava TaxID=342955 RepID=UPI0006E11E4F|nr:hypothetical protein [Lacinutrix mariniflava]